MGQCGYCASWHKHSGPGGVSPPWFPALTGNEVPAMSTIPTPHDIQGHAWWPQTDTPNERHVWHCTCGHEVAQAFGAPVPDELISHPQDHGQMRGHDRWGER